MFPPRNHLQPCEESFCPVFLTFCFELEMGWVGHVQTAGFQGRKESRETGGFQDLIPLGWGPMRQKGGPITQHG